MLALTDYLKQKDIDAFLAYLLSNYESDSRIAIWLADHLFGKAPQPLTGPDGGPVKITGVKISVRKQ